MDWMFCQLLVLSPLMQKNGFLSFFLVAYREKMRVTADQCDRQGHCLHPSGGGVSWRLAQGGVGAAEEVGTGAGQAHRSGGGGDHQPPTDKKNICAAAEGAVWSPAQHDLVSPNTSNCRNPLICISYKVSLNC